jgi:hypothetical protein
MVVVFIFDDKLDVVHFYKFIETPTGQWSDPN